MLVPPYGCFAVPLAAACLWAWPETAASRLAGAGLDRRRLTVAGIGIGAVAAAVSLVTGGQMDGHLLHGGDFQTYWVGAVVGTRYGWSRIFDGALQQSVWPSAAGAGEPFLPFLNAPPVAWLVAPLLALPYVDAYALWVAAMAICAGLVVVLLVPRAWLVPSAIITAGLWVTPYTLASGQNAVIGALAVALTWRLLRAGHDGWAGVALALITLRPNATLLLPVAILLAGYRRTFLVWLGVAGVIAGASLASLGSAGLRQFLQLALEVRTSHPHAVDMTILGLFGTNVPALALEGVLAAAALTVAWRSGRAPAVTVASGVLASVFVTPYIHAQDYVAVIAAVGAVAASTSRSSYFGIVIVALLVVAPPGWIFGVAWEAALLIVEALFLAWLSSDLLRHRRHDGRGMEQLLAVPRARPSRAREPGRDGLPPDVDG